MRQDQARPVNSIVFLLSAASFSVLAVMTVTGPLLPLIAEEFGRSVGAAGIVVTAFVLPYGAFQIVFGPLGDRAGKLRVIALALAMSTVFVAASGVVQTLESLAVMRFLSGMAMAATVPLAMAYVADEVPYAERQPVIGRFVNGLILGQIAGGSLGGIAAEYFEWRQIFYFFALLCGAIALALWRVASRQPAPLPGPEHHPRQVLATYVGVFRERRSRDVVLTAMFEGFFIFGATAYFGAFLRHQHDLSYLVIGLALAMYGVGGMIYSACVRHIVRVLGERGMIIAGTAVLGAALALLTVLPVWWLALPLFVLAGLAFYTFHNTMQVQATELSVAARGTAVSLWVFMLFVGQGLGTTVLGRVIDAFGYRTALICAALGVWGTGWWFQRRLIRRATP